MRLSIDISSLASDLPITLVDRRLLFQFRWNYRTEDWRVSVQDAADLSWLCVARRVSPGSILLDLDEGLLVPYGADPYLEADLGRSLGLEFLPADVESDVGDRDPTPTLIYPDPGL